MGALAKLGMDVRDEERPGGAVRLYMTSVIASAATD
jgi:hypothetical protein